MGSTTRLFLGLLSIIVATAVLAGCGDSMSVDETLPAPTANQLIPSSNEPGNGAAAITESENYKMIQNLGGLPVGRFSIE